MTGSSDFLNYSKGVDRLRRFVPGKWMLVVTLGLGIWAWYNHTVLVLLAVAGLFVSNVAASLVDGLIITRSEGSQESGQEGQGPGASGTGRVALNSCIADSLEEVRRQIEDQSNRLSMLEQLMKVSSTECRILREAIGRIDPVAVVSMEEIRTHDEHAEDRYLDHVQGRKSPYDWPAPSIARLEKEIEELKRKLG